MREKAAEEVTTRQKTLESRSEVGGQDPAAKNRILGKKFAFIGKFKLLLGTQRNIWMIH